MAIDEFYARSESDVVVFTLRTITFSASLVEKHKLDSYSYARIGVDSELRRIYFSFQEESAPGLSKFFSQTGKSKRKMIAIGKLYSEYEWLKPLKTEKERAKKQFILKEVDSKQEEIYLKYKFYITIGYSWSAERDFNNQDNYPKESGVYRLKKDDEVLRIGESNNIAARLKEHYSTYGTGVDKFDFEIVPNDDERKKEEKRLLEHFKDNIGKLPKLNPITN